MDAQALYDDLVIWLDAGAQDAGPYVVETSGSTGTAKRVVLARNALLASASATHARLGGPGQWLLDLPVSGVAGLQVLIRSVLAGRPPVLAADHPDLTAAIAAMDPARRRYAALVPTQLHRLDRAGRLEILAPLDAVLLGGAAADPGLVARATAAGVTVVRTYGMTETCGGCVYDGVPLDGVDVRIGDDGVVRIAGPVLFERYADDPRATEAAWDGRWFVTNDLGEWNADGSLRIIGRRDEVIVSGGVNVPLPAVTEALNAIPGVGEAVAVGVPDAEWGTRVVAVVVPAEGVCLDGVRLEVLRDAVEAAGRPRAWSPRDVVLVDRLPRLPGGKLDRLAVRQLVR